ncbi:acyl carrier protein [Phascolarctobacterium faecium]|uniref:acyl carrier protein n=1 Tax=Phascolarctobacterium faecium TaxID=33025 RepID=UPI002FDD47A0
MNLQEKLALIEEVLDVETGSLTPETLLAEVDEWDSIAALSLVVMLDEKFEKTVSGVQIKALASVNDILDYMD